MSLHVHEILERDSLPHLGHVINGWGDSLYDGHRISNRYSRFVHHRSDGAPFILQRHPEGDYHPWQSFAYAVMAGVDPFAELGASGVTLLSLAANSRRINTRSQHELGHLLFALAFLDRREDSDPFLLDGLRCTPRDLMRIALDSHWTGSFEVCRKVHETEGVCAAAALLPTLECFRSEAQVFLSGQLDILVVLGTIMALVDECTRKPESASKSVLTSLRERLVIGDFIENHCYYAGHLIELLCFGRLLGYKVSQKQMAAAIFVLNALNSLLPQYLSRLSFKDCFLHLGHYRRAATLFRFAKAARKVDVLSRATRDRFARYAVNFDAMNVVPSTFDNLDNRVADLSLFSVERPEPQSVNVIDSVVAAYSRVNSDNQLSPRGGFPHFRRIAPHSWPRAFHYEFLQDGAEIGVEVHLESRLCLALQPVVLGALNAARQLFPERTILWDSSWYKGCGRLRIVFHVTDPPTLIAGTMHLLISRTFADFDRKANDPELFNSLSD
jgi:hypothetical protein